MDAPVLGAGGSDIRRSLAAVHERELEHQLMELAKKEDLLLLATIRSTLENPKYDF